jgi:hypothetical protein
VCGQAPRVMSAAWPGHHVRDGSRTGRGHPFDDSGRDADDGDLDGGIEPREQVGHAEVGSAALDVVCICNDPHPRTRRSYLNSGVK